MSWSITDQTLAIAGVFQAVDLVQQLARSGYLEQEYFAHSLNSISKLDCSGPLDLFGEPKNLALGLDTLLNQLGPYPEKRELELTRYVVTLIHLERKLSKRSELLDEIKKGVDRVVHQTQHFPITHENVVANLAEIYTNTISCIRPRIMVSGIPVYLENPGNPERIRSLLLAGIRAIVLWRQVGGRRLQLVFKRRDYYNEAIHILNKIDDEQEEQDKIDNTVEIEPPTDKSSELNDDANETSEDSKDSSNPKQTD